MDEQEEVAIANKLIQRIEFHEGKSKYRREEIEIRFYVTNITEFIQFCSRKDRKFGESMFAFEIKRLEKSRAKRPNFRWHANQTCFVYPKENMVAVRITGLHYICQHSFDLLPSNIRELFFSLDKPFMIGMFFSLDGEKIEVSTADIADGFRLNREKEKGYKESFVRWMRERNSKRVVANIKIPCPHCGKADLEQHRRKPELLVCPLCWYKYKKKEALEGEFIRVKKKVKAGWSHPRGY